MPVRNSGPSCPAVRPARTARITATYSSIISSGGNGSMPNRPFITGFPTPRPRMNRPSAAWSSWAAVLAASTGGRSAAFAIAVPTRTRRVAAATGWHSESASPCPSATNTAPNPARSAAAASSPILADGSPLCEAIDSPIASPGLGEPPPAPGRPRRPRVGGHRCTFGLVLCGPSVHPWARSPRAGSAAVMNVPPDGREPALRYIHRPRRYIHRPGRHVRQPAPPRDAPEARA